MQFECLKIVLSRNKTLIMNLNQDRVLNDINSFRIDEKYTDTVLRFSDGHIYVHWIILEANQKIWWTLARDTNSDNIVEVILPEISLAEGLIFVEEVYSSIHSLKASRERARLQMYLWMKILIGFKFKLIVINRLINLIL